MTIDNIYVTKKYNYEHTNKNIAIHMDFHSNSNSYCSNNRRSLLSSRNDLSELIRLTRNTIDNIYVKKMRH